MTTNRAVSAGVLGLLLVGCGSAPDGDYDGTAASAGSTAGSATVAGQGGRGGQGAGGTAPNQSGAPGNAGSGAVAGAGGSMGGRAGSASGGRGGDNPGGGMGGAGGAGSGGAGAGMSGADAMGGSAGDGGRNAMGGRMGMGGRGGMGGAGGRSMGGMGTMAGAGGGLSDCPASGHVSYTLTKKANPTADEQKAYDLITEAMDKAVEYYNCYTNITKADTVTYVPSVDTADGSSNGSIRFGGKDYMEYITAMHEIAHTVGIGTASQWPSHVVDGIFNGAQATAKLRELTGIADDQVHADSQHFWPYGLNYTSEVKSEADVINHCYIVVAIRADMGLQ